MYRSIRLFSHRGNALVRRPAVRNFSADANAARGQQNAKHPEFDFKQLEKEITRLIQELRESLAEDRDDKKKASTINQHPDAANFAGSVMDFWERLEIKFTDELKTLSRDHKELLDAVSGLSKDVYSKVAKDVENAADWQKVKSYFVEVHEAAWVLLMAFNADGDRQANVAKMNAEFKQKCPHLSEKLQTLRSGVKEEGEKLHPAARKFVNSIFDNYEVLSALKSMNFVKFANEVIERYNALPDDAKKDLKAVVPVFAYMLE
ncbi:hypothetical protein AAVH_40855, partial [Aphelenchoides avenae]